jgi:V/A-type H+-transporting ATPase subunit K
VEPIIFALGWIGIYAPIAFGAIGSIIGCARAGQAAIGAMLETESGYGRYVGVSVMPSSQIIFGIVLMQTLKRAVTQQNAPALFAIGVLSGLALMISGIYQGNCCASSINVSKSKTEVFGISIAPAAVVESFSVFVFVFALILAGSVPG